MRPNPTFRKLLNKHLKSALQKQLNWSVTLVLKMRLFNWWISAWLSIRGMSNSILAYMVTVVCMIFQRFPHSVHCTDWRPEWGIHRPEASWWDDQLWNSDTTTLLDFQNQKPWGVCCYDFAWLVDTMNDIYFGIKFAEITFSFQNLTNK